jgi:hypothetical protein
MTNQHPITPPPELVRQWMERTEYDEHTWFYESYIAEQAARWGADQELVACGNYLKQCAAWEEEDVIEFYNYRRPKPPSLKEQALAALSEADQGLNKSEWQQCSNTIRRALEALPE